jgi:thioredoxin 1
MSTLAITDKTFDAEVAKSSIPVLVDFWAEWCGPCKAIGPALEQIAAEMGGKVKITKLNIDDNPLITQKFNINSIPTLMIFKDGVPAATQVGALPKTKIEAWINKSL